MLYTCPNCEVISAIPIEEDTLSNMNIKCGNCGFVSLFENPSFSDQTHIFHEISCANCHNHIYLSEGDIASLSACDLLCPHCEHAFRLPQQAPISSYVLFWRLSLIFLCLIGGLFLLFTPEGGDIISYLAQKSTQAHIFFMTFREAFFDVVAFLKGLFL